MNQKEKSFKEICQLAFQVYENLDELKCIVNELKSNPENITNSNKLKLKELCQQLNTNYYVINEKKNIRVIQKRINKRKKIKKNSDALFYQNELRNLLENRKNIFGEDDVMKNEGESINNESLSENRALDQKLEQINKDISDIQQLKDHLSILKKLITVRCQHFSRPLEMTQMNNIDILIAEVDVRRTKTELDMLKIKDEIKLKKASEHNNKNKVFKKNQSSELFLELESKIKQNLFSLDEESSTNSNNRNFQQQPCEVSMEKLVLIRQEWDHFISDSVTAESIPIEWVMPPEILLNEENEWCKFIVQV